MKHVLLTEVVSKSDCARKHIYEAFFPETIFLFRNTFIKLLIESPHFLPLPTLPQLHPWYFSRRNKFMHLCWSVGYSEVQDLWRVGNQKSNAHSVINPNHPKFFKILYMLLYDFGGFRLVECSYHVFTWGLMSQFCLSTKSVPFGHCTV